MPLPLCNHTGNLIFLLPFITTVQLYGNGSNYLHKQLIVEKWLTILKKILKVKNILKVSPLLASSEWEYVSLDTLLFLLTSSTEVNFSLFLQI